MVDHGAGKNGSAVRVLIVEDEFLIADYIAQLLEDAGHVVAGTAATAEEALRLLEDGLAVEVVSLDVKLAGRTAGLSIAVSPRGEVATALVPGEGRADRHRSATARHRTPAGCSTRCSR